MPTFLAPVMWFGAAAVGIPIALHFFYKARHRPLPWAAMTFLRQSIEQTSRRLKFQEWVLLALRCLVLLLIAMALARPAQRTAGASARGEAVDAVFVFDTSFSMGAQDGDKTRLERAKDAALAILDELPTNSSVQVYSCADRAALLGPVSRYNLDQARQLVRTVEVTGLSTDFLPGLTEALAALDSGTAPGKEVYLFTDLQKTGFERQQGAIRAKAEEIKARGSLLFVRCCNPERAVANIAVVDVTLPGGIPHTGTRVPFVVLLRNNGKTPVRDITVSLQIEGRPVNEVEAIPVDEIKDGDTVPVTVTGRLDAAGPQVLGVRVRKGGKEADDVPGDNRLDKVILVRDQVRVLVVDGTPDARNPVESGSHFVRNALTPVAANQLDEYFVKPQVVPADEASPVLLSGVDLCYLLNVPASPADKPGVPGLSAEFVERLKEFVANGGGLVIGCGDLVAADRYNLILGSAGAGLLPFDLGDVGVTAPEYPFNPAPETVETPSFLTQFRETPYNAALRGVEVTKAFKLNETGPGSSGGRVLARFANQSPFLASRVVGEGEVVMVTTSLDGRWGSFPARAEAFVPFTRMTLAHLTGRKIPGGNRVCGESLVWYPTEATRGFELVGPEGKRTRLGLAQQVGGKQTVSTSDTAQPGVYRIVAEGDPESKGPKFAVNPDLRESVNLDGATDADLKQWLGYDPPVIQAGAGTEGAAGQQRVAREWTEYVLIVLLLLLVGEAAWAWMCGKAW